MLFIFWGIEKLLLDPKIHQMRQFQEHLTYTWRKCYKAHDGLILSLVPLLTNKDVSLIMRGRLYSSCEQSSMLHGSETWPVRKENVVALQRAEMRMVRRMCGIKLKDRLPSKELRETRYR